MSGKMRSRQASSYSEHTVRVTACISGFQSTNDHANKIMHIGFRFSSFFATGRIAYTRPGAADHQIVVYWFFQEISHMLEKYTDDYFRVEYSDPQIGLSQKYSFMSG